jgi:hypothetical protein
VPPRGVWGQNGAARHATLESWLGRPLEPDYPVDELVLRYLGAFGPATPADAQAWSGLSGLREVFERLRPELITVRNEAGRELFDLPDAPRPPGDTPAPPRFLYDYDNMLLGHADRSRFISDELRRRLLETIGAYAYGSLLVDGFGAGLWRIERDDEAAVLRIRLAMRISKTERVKVAEEGERLLAFWAKDASHRDVHFSDIEEI